MSTFSSQGDLWPKARIALANAAADARSGTERKVNAFLCVFLKLP